MNYNLEKHHRRSIRLKGYDYTREGAYYFTINQLRHRENALQLFLYFFCEDYVEALTISK